LRRSLGENAHNSCIRVEPKGGGYRYVSSDNDSGTRDVDQGQASTSTLPNSRLLLEIIKAATAELTALTEQQQQIIHDLQKQLQINEQALNTIFNILDENDVPVDQLWDKLIQSAEAIKKALHLATAVAPAARGAGAFSTPLSRHFDRIYDTMDAIKNALASGQLGRADELLEQLQNLQDAKLIPQNYRSSPGSILDRASTSEQRGQLAIAQLRYDDAERHFAEAAKWLKEADATSRAWIEKVSREEAPHPWAVFHLYLGTALGKLAEWEGDAARLEEAVTAFHAALAEEAPETAWRTHYGLANALRALGERESGTVRLQEAITAYDMAIAIFASEAAKWPWFSFKVDRLTEDCRADRDRAIALLNQRRC
jgi:tetratricopeptide (TPR) repeat protein